MKKGSIGNQELKAKFDKMLFQLIMEIEFGTPSSRCQNFGVCNITPFNKGYQVPIMPNGISLGLVTIYGLRKVEINFFKNSLTQYSYDRYFSSNYFLVEEDYKHPTQHNNSKRILFEIKEGKYAVENNNSLLKVSFQ